MRRCEDCIYFGRGGLSFVCMNEKGLTKSPVTRKCDFFTTCNKARTDKYGFCGPNGDAFEEGGPRLTLIRQILAVIWRR